MRNYQEKWLGRQEYSSGSTFTCGVISLSCVFPAKYQHSQFRVFLCKGFMVSLCHAVVTVFAVRGKSVCRGHKGFQAQRQVADQNTCVGLRAVFGGTFARFVLDKAVGSCSHQYYWLKHFQLLRFPQLMKGQSNTWLINPRAFLPHVHT